MPANVILAASATGESIRLAVCEAIEQRAGLRRATVLFGSQGEADAIRRFWATERPDLSMGVESSTLSAFVDGRWTLFGDGTSVATPARFEWSRCRLCADTLPAVCAQAPVPLR